MIVLILLAFAGMLAGIFLLLKMCIRDSYCMVRLAAAEEQAAQYKKRARNTVIFYVIAESIWQIKDLILYYYS